MFYQEGNTTAMLVTNRLGRRKATAMPFPQAEAALAWCRSNGSMLVYSPLARNRN
jgi:hypothetical protein